MNEIQRLFDWALSEKPEYDKFMAAAARRLSASQLILLEDAAAYVSARKHGMPYELGLSHDFMREAYDCRPASLRNLTLALVAAVTEMEENVPVGNP